MALSVHFDFLFLLQRSGRRYGPPASKRMIVFIDDINLPYIETYGTQNSIALLTQHMVRHNCHLLFVILTQYMTL